MLGMPVGTGGMVSGSVLTPRGLAPPRPTRQEARARAGRNDPATRSSRPASERADSAHAHGVSIASRRSRRCSREQSPSHANRSGPPTRPPWSSRTPGSRPPRRQARRLCRRARRRAMRGSSSATASTRGASMTGEWATGIRPRCSVSTRAPSLPRLRRRFVRSAVETTTARTRGSGAASRGGTRGSRFVARCASTEVATSPGSPFSR